MLLTLFRRARRRLTAVHWQSLVTPAVGSRMLVAPAVTSDRVTAAAVQSTLRIVPLSRDLPEL
jgi:hypothetical protein